MRASKKLELQNPCASQKNLSIRHFKDQFTSNQYFTFIPLTNTSQLMQVLRDLDYGLDCQRLQSKEGHEIFLFSKMSRPALGPNLSLFKDYWGSFQRVKYLESEAHHSPQASAKITINWHHTSAPLKCLYGMNRGQPYPLTLAYFNKQSFTVGSLSVIFYKVNL